MKELWEDIIGFEAYEVSNIGRVKRKSYKRWLERNGSYGDFKEHFLKPYQDKDGYLKVTLHCKNRSKTILIHRLVAMAFIPNPENKPQVNHKNGIKDDNRLENLEWVTASEQRKHAYDTGLQSAKGEKNGQAKLTQDEVDEIRAMGNAEFTHQFIADKFCISRAHVTGILNGTYWSVPDSIYDVHLIYTIG